MIVRDAPSSSPVAPVATPPQSSRPPHSSRSSQGLQPQPFRSFVPVWIAYLVAVVGMVAAGAGDWFFPAVFAPFPLVLGALVVVIAAGLGGLGPGLLATAFGAITGVVFLQRIGDEPRWRVALPVAVFVAFGVLISVLNAARLRAARRVSEARGELVAVLGDLTDGVLLQDRAHGLMFANDAAARLVGFASGEELRQATARVLTERFEFLDARGQSVPVEVFSGQGAMRGERGAETVFEVRDRTTGHTRWWAVQATPLAPARKGNANAAVTVFRDVTVQRQSDNAVATSERRLRALIAHSADAFALLDARGAFLFTSPAVSTVLGYREDELRGVNAFSLVHPSDVARMTTLMTTLRGAETSPSVVVRLRHYDGRWRWIEATGSDLTHDPAVRAALLNMRDITDRKHAEDALTTSERRFHALLEHTADAIMVTDSTGDIIYASPATERLLGYTPDALVATASSSFSHMHPADVASMRAFFQSLTTDSDAQAAAMNMTMTVYRMRHRDGTYRRVEMTATNLLHDPAVRGVVGNYRDITEQARAVARQQFLHAANGRFTVTPVDENALAAVAGAAVPEFAGGCAVELRGDSGKLRRAFTALPSGLSSNGPDLFATTPAAAYVARALITGQPALFAPAISVREKANDAAEASDSALPVSSTPPASMLVVPLIARGVTLGAVTFVAPPDAPFDTMDRDIAEEFAGRLALALTQTRLVTEVGVAETRYRLLFESIRDAVLVADADGNYTDANPAFTDLVGYTIEEIRRLRIGAFAGDPKREADAFAAHRSVERWHDETALVRKDGAQVSVEGWTTAMHTANGVSYLSIWRDLSAQGVRE